MPKVQTPMHSWLIGFALLGLLTMTSTATRADSDDQERAREAMLSGSVRPLSELLVRVEALYEGTVIEVELEDDEKGRLVGPNGAPALLYEIKLLTPQGNVVKLAFDALTLELLTVKGHDSERARKAKDKNDD